MKPVESSRVIGRPTHQATAGGTAFLTFHCPVCQRARTRIQRISFIAAFSIFYKEACTLTFSSQGTLDNAPGDFGSTK